METEVEVKKLYRLPKEFAKKWLEALRSGKYKQGTGMLRRATLIGFEYCCLGVAGEITGCTTMAQRGCFAIDVIKEYAFTEEEVAMIPKELVGKPGANGLVRECVTMNDYEGMNFTEIADWIEGNVEFYEEG